jgi:hypothetical protein
MKARFTVDHLEENMVVLLLANSCFKFMKNHTKYLGEKFGGWKWAYTGDQIVCKVTVEQFKRLRRFVPEGDTHVLRVNGKVIGTVELDNPPYYPALFLRLYLANDMKFDPKVVRRFATFSMYHGVDQFNPMQFDLEHIHVEDHSQDPIPFYEELF